MANLAKYTRVVISYTDIFPDETVPAIKDLIKDIPSIQCLEIITHFSAVYHANDNNSKIQIESIRMWAGRLSESIKKQITITITPFILNKNFLFINQPTCLFLTQEILLNFNSQESRILTPKDELNLFKAYLVAAEWSKDNSRIIENTGLQSFEDFVSIFLETQLKISGLKISKEFYIQAYKAIEFFEFCENTEGFKCVINDFIISRNLKDWRQYLKSILHIYASHLLKSDQPNKSILQTNIPEDICIFLDSLSVNKAPFVSKHDFIGIRERPVFKMDTQKYLFMNIDLFIDKLFDGIIFDIYANTSNKTYEGVSNRDFLEFKSQIGEIFTEKYLFYGVMRYLNQSDWLVLSGDEIDKTFPGAPDYYIRRKSRVFIFECKDTLISSKSKNSNSIKTIEEEINKKLVTGTSKSIKGVSQIYSFIGKLLNSDFNRYDDCDYSNCKFYPVLIVTDRCLDEYGIIQLVKENSLKAISTFGLHDSRISHPTIIQLDDLIKFGNLIRNRKLNFSSLIDSYHASLDSKNYFEKTKSFNEYLKLKAHRHKSELSDLIDTKFDSFFNTEEK